MKTILDDEIRLRVESRIIEECAKRTLRKVQVQKKEILLAVKKDVVKYFRNRGINITNIGYKGALTYTSDAIQQAINKEFIADRNKAAQDKVNNMNVATAKAEAYQIKLRSSTIVDQIKLTKLQIDKIRANKWNGVYPTHYFGSGKDGLILNVGK